MDWQAIGLVSVGAVIGALLRFGMSTWIPTTGFPRATLAVNFAGAFLIGLVMFPEPAEHVTRLWFVVGPLGSVSRSGITMSVSSSPFPSQRSHGPSGV